MKLFFSRIIKGAWSVSMCNLQTSWEQDPVFNDAFIMLHLAHFIVALLLLVGLNRQIPKERMILSLYITFPLALATLRIRSFRLQSQKHLIKVLGVAEFKPLLESEILYTVNYQWGEMHIHT